MIGCDGAGKTELAYRLKKDLPEVESVLVGKHLYRKSFVYKLSVLLPLMFMSRERFDELVAPLVYPRACPGLAFRRWKAGDRLTLIDRSITELLYVDRKSDRPHFCRSLWMTRVIGRRIPTVHLVLPYRELCKRKQEISERGHAAHDRDISRHFLHPVPTSYVAFNNDRSRSDAAAAMARIALSESRRPGVNGNATLWIGAPS